MNTPDQPPDPETAVCPITRHITTPEIELALLDVWGKLPDHDRQLLASLKLGIVEMPGYPGGNCIYDPEDDRHVITLGRDGGRVVYRFTIAHELAHVVLRHVIWKTSDNEPGEWINGPICELQANWLVSQYWGITLDDGEAAV